MEKHFSNSEKLKLIEGLVRITVDRIVINKMAENKFNIKLDYYEELLKDFDNIGDNAFSYEEMGENLSCEGFIADDSVNVEETAIHNILLDKRKWH